MFTRHENGSILAEALIVIAVLAVIGAIASETVYVSLESTVNSEGRSRAVNLQREMIETAEAVAEEKWQNVYGLLKDGGSYHTEKSGGAWNIVSGSENVLIVEETFTRFFTVANICRNAATKAITGATDSSGAGITCNISGGIFDPSTQKISATISWGESYSLSNAYYITRWRNKVCAQTSWSESRQGGVKTCPDTAYETSSNVSTGDSIQICSGGC